MKIAVLIIGLCFTILRLPAQTEQEPNDNFAQANPVAIGTPMSGVTCAFPQTDFFRIILPQDGTLKILTSISANDPSPSGLTFTVYSKTQTPFQDFNMPAGANSLARQDSILLGCLSADTFYIAIHSNSVGFGYCFNYQFSYTVLTPQFANDAEPNNNFLQAQPLAYNTTTEGHLGFSGNPGNHLDNDFYRIILPTDGVLRVITSTDYTASSSKRLNVSLYSKKQNSYNDLFPKMGSYGNAISDTVYWGCLSADTMYLNLFINNINDCGFSYKIKYDVLTPVFSNDAEPNDNLPQALPLAYNTIAQGHLGFKNNPGNHLDDDYYRIVLPNDGTIRAIIQAESANGATTMNLSLIDKNGTPFFDYSPHVGPNHTVAIDTFYWGCISADTLYLRTFINNIIDCGITYTIRYDVLPPLFGMDIEPNNNFIQAKNAPLNTNVDGHLGFTNHPGNHLDDDYYKIFLPAPGDLKVIVSSENPWTTATRFNVSIYNRSQSAFTFDGNPHVGALGIPVTDTIDFGCLASDTFYIRMYINNIIDCGISYRLKFLFTKQLNLGNDTTICGNINLILNAGSGYTSYLWNTGATTQTINVTNPGSYSVTVTGGCGTLKDTIRISSGGGPSLQLPNDTTICSGNININLTVPVGFSNILWSTGSTSQQITVSSAGTYWVQAQSACGLANDTIRIFSATQPVVNLGNDTTICGNINLTLNAGSGYISYLWNTGATGQTITVIDTGYYSVRVVNTCGNTLRDTIHIGRGSGPQLQLPNDTTVCSGNINIPLSVPASFTNIVWSTGSNASQITVTAAGTYWVRAQSSCGIVSDTIHIFSGNIQVTGNSVQNFTISAGSSVTLTSCAIGNKYLWRSSQPINCDTCRSIIVFPATSPATYISTVTGNSGCSFTCTYNITFSPIFNGIAIPNAFTPNGDGLNDVFKILNVGTTHLNYLKIFNRFGELIFTTTNIFSGWDGTYKGKESEVGAYVYEVDAKDDRGTPIFRKGIVMLIR